MFNMFQQLASLLFILLTLQVSNRLLADGFLPDFGRQLIQYIFMVSISHTFQ